jgi:hypothetical protein
MESGEEHADISLDEAKRGTQTSKKGAEQQLGCGKIWMLLHGEA